MSRKPKLSDLSHENQRDTSEARQRDLPGADGRPADVEMARVLKTAPLRMASDPSSGAVAHWKQIAVYHITRKWQVELRPSIHVVAGDMGAEEDEARFAAENALAAADDALLAAEDALVAAQQHEVHHHQIHQQYGIHHQHESHLPGMMIDPVSTPSAGGMQIR